MSGLTSREGASRETDAEDQTHDGCRPLLSGQEHGSEQQERREEVTCRRRAAVKIESKDRDYLAFIRGSGVTDQVR